MISIACLAVAFVALYALGLFWECFATAWDNCSKPEDQGKDPRWIHPIHPVTGVLLVEACVRCWLRRERPF